MCYTKIAPRRALPFADAPPRGAVFASFSIFLRGCKQPKSVLKRAESMKLVSRLSRATKDSVFPNAKSVLVVLFGCKDKDSSRKKQT